ncbi:hypothetical protein [Streptomyces bobili]|uniref:hypothetical protein n=1 Tax=Streptomyces bobili TaxID=67280 RepID=UPI00117F059C|nr:hypothetical protein [Streptomyces bobili]
MARISRRTILQAVNSSILAAALALPTGLPIATADSQRLNEGRAGALTRSTDPPPSPSDTPNGSTGPTTSPDSPPSPEPSGPTGSTTPPSSTPSGTSDTSDPPNTDEQTSELPPGQKAEIDEATNNLNKEKERVPEELVPTVETLITIVRTVEDPETLPQDRQGVVESTKNLSTTLAAISDPRTPPELRRELNSIVKQVTSALETVNGPQGATEERSMFILVVKRTTSTLDLIRNPRTPQDLRGHMIAIVKDTTYAAERSQNGPQVSSAEKQFSNSLLADSSSQDIMHDKGTPPREQGKLAQITRQVSALLRKISDPGTSQDERSKLTKELDDKTSRMKDQQEQSASTQKRPEESLGKAAAFCTSAIFESTAESALVRALDKLLPAQWETEGVKDFWKAEENSDDTLDVLAQLRNDKHTHSPFEVIPLITELAELVPHDKLFGSLGASALSCEQTAAYLDEDGVAVGTWLTKAGE